MHIRERSLTRTTLPQILKLGAPSGVSGVVHYVDVLLSLADIVANRELSLCVCMTQKHKLVHDVSAKDTFLVMIMSTHYVDVLLSLTDIVANRELSLLCVCMMWVHMLVNDVDVPMITSPIYILTYDLVYQI